MDEIQQEFRDNLGQTVYRVQRQSTGAACWCAELQQTYVKNPDCNSNSNSVGWLLEKNTGAASVVRGEMIPVQPTAVARRTTAVGGRRCITSGRKPLTTSPESLANKRKRREDSCHLILPKKEPRKAGHNLSQCVSTREKIGKSFLKMVNA